MNKAIKYSVLGLALALGSSSFAHAETATAVSGGFLSGLFGFLFPPPPAQHQAAAVAPEVDPSLALSGLMLLGGTLTVLRARKSK